MVVPAGCAACLVMKQTTTDVFFFCEFVQSDYERDTSKPAGTKGSCRPKKKKKSSD